MDQNQRKALSEECDFEMVADEIRGMLKLIEDEGRSKGQEACYDPESLEALYPFMDTPSKETAAPLLKAAPFLHKYFELCSPGGDSYALKELLGEKAYSAFAQPPSLERAARSSASALITMAKEVAPAFKRALTTGSSLSPELVIPQVEAEVCAIYLHLYRRNAFRKLGDDRARFLDQLQGQVAARLSPGISPDAFSVLCYELDLEYSAYKEIPDNPGDGPGGTVFWEFGKRLGFKYQGYNPIGLQIFMLAVMEKYIALLGVTQES